MSTFTKKFKDLILADLPKRVVKIAPKDKIPFATPIMIKANYLPLIKLIMGFIACCMGLVVTLVAVLFFAVKVETLRNNIKEEKINYLLYNIKTMVVHKIVA
ncbi:MAG: hypothetical protein ABJA71_02020 [Ginsengibacter sp.]